jgi:hypothetical protein
MMYNIGLNIGLNIFLFITYQMIHYIYIPMVMYSSISFVNFILVTIKKFQKISY